ncbi:MAG: 39S ribosomal protein L24, mitochondrial [Trichoglossum hirsutum]|nr:MAG: 39S ribosomal protein L24, mitochondrial [Trichoglossum hirsutum]
MSAVQPSLTFSRLFHASPPRLAKSANSRLAHLHRNVPPYPYGPSHTYKQSNFGLYGGTHIQFGNTVSSNMELKNRRIWRPNIRTKRLYSGALGRWIRTRVSARVLRTIDKEGGLDAYLLGEKPARIKELGMAGWRLRWRIMQTETVRNRFQEERRRLGLLGDTDGQRRASDGRPIGEEELQAEIKEYDRVLDRGDELAIGEAAGVGAKGDEEVKFMEENERSRPTI